jgi:hypothetical protein
VTLHARIAAALRPAAPAQARCGACRHFRNEPFELERALPGYAVLGSALGAVRAGDGHCERHQRLVAALGGCAAFAARIAAD